MAIVLIVWIAVIISLIILAFKLFRNNAALNKIVVSIVAGWLVTTIVFVVLASIAARRSNYDYEKRPAETVAETSRSSVANNDSGKSGNLSTASSGNSMASNTPPNRVQNTAQDDSDEAADNGDDEEDLRATKDDEEDENGDSDDQAKCADLRRRYDYADQNALRAIVAGSTQEILYWTNEKNKLIAEYRRNKSCGAPNSGICDRRSYDACIAAARRMKSTTDGTQTTTGIFMEADCFQWISGCN